MSCEKLTHEIGSLNNDVSKIQDEAMSFSKFKTKNIGKETICQDKRGHENLNSTNITSKWIEKPKVMTKGMKNSTCFYSKPIIPQTHISNFYGIQVPIANNEEMKQFYKPTIYDTFKPHKAYFKNKYHSKTSTKRKNSFQRRDNSYQNNAYQKTNNSNFSCQDTPWKIFSEFGLKILCNLLQDPRMYNMGMVYANLNGPIRKWGPRA